MASEMTFPPRSGQRIFTGVFSLGGYMSFELVVIFILVLIFTAMATGFAIWFNREGEDSE